MNIIYRIQRKFNYLMDNKYLDNQRKEILNELRINDNKKNIYFFSVPLHSNLGDQAQYFCWLKLFKQYYPEYNIISLPARTTTDEALELIKEQLTPDDKLFIHSGYLIYDPHPELPFICKVINAFHNHHITILPQTINLISEKKKQEVSACFNAHPNLTIISRDKVSLQKAHHLFPNCSRLLWPDVVTSLIGNPDFQYNDSKRDGIMFCIRNDGEKYYSEEQIIELKNRFHEIKTVEIDTTISLSKRDWDSKRESLIRNVIATFAKYQLIITDRYHGTIFSQIANTPVIVLSSTDHKLISGVEWFPKEYFGENVFWANNLDEVYNLVKKILDRNRKGHIIKNPSWFNDTFFSKNKFAML